MTAAGTRWTTLATLILALAVLFALPRFAAGVVRGAIESDSAADRAAFAAGDSPWSWHFREPDDVVAGRSFGSGVLEAGNDGLVLHATDGSAMELGLPLSRQADLMRLDTLRLRASASAAGMYGLVVREALDEPIRQARLGSLPPDELRHPIPLERLVWTDTRGQAVDPPARAELLRLVVTLPAGAAFTIDKASLDPESGVIIPPTGSLPSRLSAEGLLAWRDNQRAADPLVTFGTLPAAAPLPAWRPWLLPIGYLLVLAAGALRPLSQARSRLLVEAASPHPTSLPNPHPSPKDTAYPPTSSNPYLNDTVSPPTSSLRRQEPSDSGHPPKIRDILDAALVLIGPLWFIAGLGLSSRPAPPDVVMFAAGVVYAIFLNSRRTLPAWHWIGAWREAGWPLLAIPVAIGLVAFVGHAPLWPPVGRVLVYLGWALFQQWLLLAVFGALLARALPRPWAALLTALAFSLLHTPNGLLMQLCFVAELGWAWWYFHRRALLPVALAHSVSAVLLQAGLAGGVLRSLEVSARFLN